MIQIRCVGLTGHRHRYCRVKSSWRDEYSHLNDRIDAPPPSFPSLKSDRSIRFTIVRHGQSTWNAANRIQGSSDLSELTDKGKNQAELSREMLKDMDFDLMFASPLRRARETAEIIIRGRTSLPRHDLLVLREIDLYSFQGLIKQEVKEIFPSQHKNWKNRPELFEIDDHAPCREMWHRGGLAWHQLMKVIEDSDEGEARDLSVLVVAHNNMNQALISTALGLPCTYFRRFVQSNAAMSSLLVSRAGPSQQIIKLEFLNQSPSRGLSILSQHTSHDDKVARIIVVAATRDAGHVEKIRRLLSRKDEKEISLFVDQSSDAALSMCQGGLFPDVASLSLPSDHPWPHIKTHSSQHATTIIITSQQTASSIICQALDLQDTPEQRSVIHMSSGGVSILEIEDQKVIAHCLNITSHLK